MAKFVEKDTLVPVDIRGIHPYRGGVPVSVVTMPDGSEWTIESDLIYEHFDIVTPQSIEVTGCFGSAYSRTTGDD